MSNNFRKLFRLFISGEKGQATSFRSFVDLLFRVQAGGTGRTKKGALLFETGRTSRERSGRWSGLAVAAALHMHSYTTKYLHSTQFAVEKEKEEAGGETRWPETKRSLNRQRELLRWRRGKRTLKKKSLFFSSSFSLFLSLSLHFGGDSCHDIHDIQDQRVWKSIERGG